MRLLNPTLLLAITMSCLAADAQPMPSAGRQIHDFVGPAFTVAAPSFHKMIGPFPPPPLHMELTNLIAPDMNLSDEQISNLARIKQATDSKVEELSVQLHNLEKEFQNALLVNEKSKRNASSVRAEILQQKAMLDNLIFDAAQEMVGVLTPEQKKQIKLTLDKKELFPYSPGRMVIFEKSVKCPKREP